MIAIKCFQKGEKAFSTIYLLIDVDVLHVFVLYVICVYMLRNSSWLSRRPGAIFHRKRNLLIQGRMRIFEKKVF